MRFEELRHTPDASRNTAPALTLAALKAQSDGSDPVLIVMPADHAIADVAAFERAIGVAARLAQAGGIVTLGVMPDRAECGYDYIELGEPIATETADAVLVADKRHAQDVKTIVSQLKDRGYSETKHHRKVHRPWGSYESLEQGSRFQVKRIVVMPGAALSLQLHEENTGTHSNSKLSRSQTG